jgi:hypothetical protein
VITVVPVDIPVTIPEAVLTVATAGVELDQVPPVKVKEYDLTKLNTSL